MSMNRPRTLAAITLAALSAAAAGGGALAGAQDDRQPENENRVEERIPSVADTTRTSWKQMHQLAEQLDAGMYMYVPEDAVLFAAGQAVDYSGRDEEGIHNSGTTLDSGVWLFPENSVIQWPDGMVHVLDADAVIIPRSDLPDAESISESTCKANCRISFSACCLFGEDGEVRCLCLSDTDDDLENCHAGGLGAESCSITNNNSL